MVSRLADADSHERSHRRPRTTRISDEVAEDVVVTCRLAARRATFVRRLPELTHGLSLRREITTVALRRDGKVNDDDGHFTEAKSVTFTNFAGQYAFMLWQAGSKDFQPR
jgi:hypothetical protein